MQSKGWGSNHLLQSQHNPLLVISRRGLNRKKKKKAEPKIKKKECQGKDSAETLPPCLSKLRIPQSLICLIWYSLGSGSARFLV